MKWKLFVVDPNKKRVVVRLYKFKNRLKEMTAGLGVKTAEISPAAIEAAEKALSEMSEDYPDWVTTLIDQLGDLHRRCFETPQDRKKYFEEIGRISHDMKGQGGTFGYPLISTFSDSLNGFCITKGELTDDHVEIIKAHVDSMRAVINGRVKGDGGEIGIQLTKGLQAAIKKRSA